MNRAHRLALPAAILLCGCAPILGQSHDPAYDGHGPGANAANLVPGLVVYQDSIGPLSYRSTATAAGAATGASLASGALREVRGKACQSAITLPVGLVWAAIRSGNPALAPTYLSGAWGEGGYAEAVSKALAETPSARLVDVRADLQIRIVLGVWRQQCVQVTALAVPAR